MTRWLHLLSVFLPLALFGAPALVEAGEVEDGDQPFMLAGGRVVCDAGGCWQRVPQPSNIGSDGYRGFGSGRATVLPRARENDRFDQRRDRRGYGRDPWNEPDRAFWGRRDNGRFVERDRKTVCDQATRVCYRKGRIDKSETRDAFGNRAAERADDIRDRTGRSDIFVRPRRGWD